MKNITYTRVMGFLIGMLLLVSIFDPSNKLFYSKYPVFIILFIFTLYGLASKRIIASISQYMVILSFVLMGVSGYAISLFFDYGVYDKNIGVSLGTPFLFSIILLAINSDPERFRRTLFCVLVILCFLILGLGIILLVDPQGPNNPIIDYLNFTSESAKITFREFGYIKLPMVYYKTSALLLIGIAILFKDKQRASWRFMLLSYLFMLAFLLSGTRANIIVCLAVFMLLYLHKRNGITKAFILFLIFSCIAMAVPILLDTFFSSTEVSNTIKLGHINSYKSLFLRNIRYVFIGDGFGSPFYTVGLGEAVYNTELVYLDLIRWFGMLPFSFILLLLLYPAMSFVYQKDIVNLSCYLGYLIITATNPLLMSSTGMLAISFFYYEALNNRQPSYNFNTENSSL